MKKKIFIGLLCVIFMSLVLYIYWYYIRPRHYKKLYQKLDKFKGFKKSHLQRSCPPVTNQPEELSPSKPITNTAKLATHTNSHMLLWYQWVRFLESLFRSN